MSYETARYILWALMCVPVLWLGLHLINSVINDTLDIKRRNAARRKKIAEERKQQELMESEKRRFETEYRSRSRRGSHE